MKMKDILIEQTEGVAKATPPTQNENALTQQTRNTEKDINNWLNGKDFLKIASLYTKLNFKAFPVKFQGKNPLCKQGFKAATNEAKILENWSKAFPNCNIGIPTGSPSGIFVVDIDGEEGLKSLAELEAINGRLEAPTVITGKGKHLYFKLPEGLEIKSSVCKIACHIDIRGEGGYVVAPPSLHENGHLYTWENFPNVNKGFPEAPQWLLDMVSKPRHNPKIAAILEEIANAPEGQRNDTLLRKTEHIANLYKEQGLNFEELKRDISETASQTGLPQEEISKTIDNAFAHVKQKPDNASNADIEFSDDPDMSILKSNMLLPAPKINTKHFGGFEQWVKDTAECTNAPVDYVAFSLLAGATGVIGLSRTVSPWRGWEQPCCLWVGAVGEPSSGKTPATAPIQKILREVELSRKESYKTSLRRWKKEKEVAEQKEINWKKEIKKDIDNATDLPENAICPDKPQTYRFVFCDVTQEALIQDMRNNIKGGLLFRDELSGWLLGMNRYSSGSSERSFWLEAYNSNCYTTGRVKYDDERLEVENLLVSVFGTIQPQRVVNTLLGDRGDGFLSRFIWVYPEPVRAAIPQSSPNPDFVTNAFKKLDSLLDPYAKNAKEQRKCLNLSTEAIEAFGNWYIPHKEKADKEENLLKHFLSKGQGNVLRLALLLEYLWWSCTENQEPAEISKKAVETAIDLYDNYIVPMCERVYTMYFPDFRDAEARSLAKWILENKPEKFILRDIYYKGNVKHIRTKSEAEKAARTLINFGWLTYIKKRKGTHPGRQRNVYYVNPRVYTQEVA